MQSKFMEFQDSIYRETQACDAENTKINTLYLCSMLTRDDMHHFQL